MELILIRGLSGSGKSTLAQKLVGEGEIVETDTFFHDSNGIYKFDSSRLGEAHQWAQDYVRLLMKERARYNTYRIVVANTFSKNWEMSHYLRMAAEFGYAVTVITVESDLSDAQLAARSIHNVPESAITRMRQRWESLYHND